MRSGVDPLDARYVTAEAPHGRVHDRLDPLVVQGAELADRICHPDVLVPPQAVTIVLHVLSGQGENVLVHECRAEIADLNWPPYRFYCRHGASSASVIA